MEAHVLVAFVAYCLLVTLKNRLQALAPGLTVRAVLETLAALQMLEVVFPTTDGSRLVMPRPAPEQKLLLYCTSACRISHHPKVKQAGNISSLH